MNKKLNNKVYQYSFDGKLVKIWHDIHEVENTLKTNSVRVALRKKHISIGYVWLEELNYNKAKIIGSGANKPRAYLIEYGANTFVVKASELDGYNRCKIIKKIYTNNYKNVIN